MIINAAIRIQSMLFPFSHTLDSLQRVTILSVLSLTDILWQLTFGRCHEIGFWCG